MISVIIPAYNAGQYLPELLDGVLRQSYQNYEVILVNDGSTDDTGVIIDRYVQAHPDVFRGITQENQGVSAARNKALPAARGEYIAFLDADDLIEDTYLEKLLNAIARNQTDIAKCSYTDFDGQTGKILNHVSAADRTMEYAPGKFFTFHYNVWASLYRAAFIRENRLLFSVGEQMEDPTFSLLANNLASGIAVVNEELYHHRMHENSILSNVKKARSDPKIPYRGMEEAIKKLEWTPFREFCFVRALTDYSTERFKTQGSAVRRPLAKYMVRIMDTYFPNADQNPYIVKKTLSKQPGFEYLAIKMFVQAYKMGLLYPFSAVTSFILRYL